MRTRSSILIWRDFLSFERFRSNGKRARASSREYRQTFSMRTRREIPNMRAVSSLARFDRASPMACAHGVRLWRAEGARRFIFSARGSLFPIMARAARAARGADPGLMATM